MHQILCVSYKCKLLTNVSHVYLAEFVWFVFKWIFRVR